MHLALGGVVLALAGLLLSLFVRPRRVWVRARPGEAGGSEVEVAGLDRSTAGDVEAEVAAVVSRLREFNEPANPEEERT
jgi:cytochrome c biogenesis protein